MSLLDALLLDPYPVNVWVAVRSDGIKGSGTLGDPYDGSTVAEFDQLMRDFAAQTTSTVGIRVNLGPGIFQTAGYYDGIGGSNGWQPSARMKIVGSGIDVTTLKLVSDASEDTQGFAVGHVLGSNTDPVDFFEISDLTINCDVAHQENAIAACAIRIKGNHSRIRRVKVVQWGTRTPSKPCYVIASITADAGASTPGIFDTVIDECILVDPGDTVSEGEVICLHVGDRGAGPVAAEPSGESAVIRNCFVDAEQSDLPSGGLDIRALSVSWCHGAIIEGNQIYNTRYGGPHQSKVSVREVIVRNNFYKNVIKGPFLDLGRVGTDVTATDVDISDDVVTVETPSAHRLNIGDRIQVTEGLSGTLPAFFEITGAEEAEFTFTSDRSESGTFKFKKVLGVDKLLVEGNTIELALSILGADETPMGVHVRDQSLISTRPPFVNGQMLIRGNRIRYVDSLMSDEYIGEAIRIEGASDLIIQQNIVELWPLNPMKNSACGSVNYFYNSEPDGTVIQGFNDDTDTTYDELETVLGAEAEDALTLTLFNRR